MAPRRGRDRPEYLARLPGASQDRKRNRARPPSEPDDGGHETSGEAALSDEVFQINYKEAVEDVQARFRDWLERVVERGLALWESAL